MTRATKKAGRWWHLSNSAGDDLRRPKPRVTPPAWTQEAWGRYAQLLGRLEHVPKEHRASVEATLAKAKECLDDPVPSGVRRRLANWWNGDLIEQTWTWLAQSEIEIVQHSDVEGLRIAVNVALQRAQAALSEKNSHRVALEAMVSRTSPKGAV